MPKKIDPAAWLVLQELKKKLLQVLPKDKSERRLLLAVSGGADSLTLAHAMAQLAEELECTLRVCHVEHGLRGAEALADAELVENFCKSVGLGFVCCHVDVKAFCRVTGCSIEEGARTLRYEALKKQAEVFGTSLVVTAHHRDDQVETFFLKLLRGAGPEGLTGMALCSEQGPLTLVRPLLELGRLELEAYCQANGLEYCVDSSNLDCTYTRNRIRLKLLPMLEQEFNSGIRNNIISTMKLLEEQESFLKAEECRYWQLLADINDEDHSLSFKVKQLQELEPVIRKRLFRKAYFYLGGRELSQERTEAIETLLLKGTGGKNIQLPQNIIVIYLKGKIIIRNNERE